MTRDQCFFNMGLKPPYGDMVPAASMIHWSRCASRGMPWDHEWSWMIMNDHEWSWMISWSHGSMIILIYIYILIIQLMNVDILTIHDLLRYIEHTSHWAHITMLIYVVWNVSLRCQICQASACIKTSSLWSSCSQAPRSKSIAATSWQIRTDSAFIADDRNIRNRI